MTASINEKKYLKGKFALVTGSSRGIGRGIALRLAEKGVTVAVNYLKDEAAAPVVFYPILQWVQTKPLWKLCAVILR